MGLRRCSIHGSGSVTHRDGGPKTLIHWTSPRRAGHQQPQAPHD